MTPLDAVAPYSIVEYVTHKVSWESFVLFGRSKYSVPHDYAGKQVLVGCRDEKVSFARPT